ncbi:hypothetical protein FISHEDRAFT_43651 [Fistulina hepatica ATCC 64428]|uniref:Uncharacterized protein n=1 Tax=Fistulina hepatica ATCC 64428 TaxID=1128425 RepID=A0A0D7ACR4_9AGAR|nr:hypothetical protein FISHEDRAFT_43651 [Fistulina hepatica ATCC 64428]
MRLTTDTPEFNVQSDPSTRGTWGIFSTCLSTLIICVWTAVHVDTPAQRSLLWSILVKLGWMIIGLFAPELLLLLAYRQWAAAQGLMQPLLDHNSNERQFQSPWTLTHAFYACMGGYAFDFPEVKEADSVISPYGIKFLVNHFPHLLPEVSDDNICDRDQGSSLAKTISLVQLLWFCVNCASRRTQGLPISLLEVTTLAHAICMFVTYLFWFDKPLDVNGPTLIADTPEARQVCALIIKTTFETALYDMPNLPKGVNNDQVLLRPNSSLQSFILGDAVPGVEGVYRSGLATPLLYAMYGIPHFIGWNAVFPTSIEQTLWRTATIFITGWGVILCIAVILIFRLYPHPKWSLIHVLIAFYGAASVYVVTESLRQLFYLPPGAYELPSWSNYWPHFS